MTHRIREDVKLTWFV